MGSSQSSKTHVNSPPMELEKLRLVNGSMKEGPRPRIPGPRAKGRAEEGGGAREVRRSASKSSSGDGSRGEVSRRESNDNGLMKKAEEDELVNGWPKWLVDNIPSDVLKNIVPKSADSYNKIDKVSVSFFEISHFFLGFGCSNKIILCLFYDS